MDLLLLLAYLAAWIIAAGYVRIGHWLLVEWNPVGIGEEDES